jgi:hypothetical protein
LSALRHSATTAAEGIVTSKIEKHSLLYN